MAKPFATEFRWQPSICFIRYRQWRRIVLGKRVFTPETAWLFSQDLGTTPEFWISLQSAYDLARSRLARVIERISATVNR